MSEWISIKEQMPEDGVRVLVYSKHKWISIGSTIKGHEVKKFYDGDGLSSNSITHWMPLPELPTEL